MPLSRYFYTLVILFAMVLQYGFLLHLSNVPRDDNVADATNDLLISQGGTPTSLETSLFVQTSGNNLHQTSSGAAQKKKVPEAAATSTASTTKFLAATIAA